MLLWLKKRKIKKVLNLILIRVALFETNDQDTRSVVRKELRKHLKELKHSGNLFGYGLKCNCHNNPIAVIRDCGIVVDLEIQFKKRLHFDSLYFPVRIYPPVWKIRLELYNTTGTSSGWPVARVDK